MENKILLITVVFQEFDVIKKHVESIIPILDRVDWVILENMSETTESTIKPYLIDLLKDNKLFQYRLFDKNIGGTVFTIFFKTFGDKLNNYDYVIVTDGDIQLYSPNELLDEILNIINNAPDAFSCAADISAENLPIKNFPQAAHWIPIPIDHGWYLECATGGHFLTLKRENLIKYLDLLKETGEVFCDGGMRKFCIKIGKKWLKTKFNKIRHITWDLYHDLDHPYTKMKIQPLSQIFFVSEYCDHTIYSLNNNEIVSDIFKWE